MCMCTCATCCHVITFHPMKKRKKGQEKNCYMLSRLRRAPLHWKILFGGQFFITLGLIKYRLSAIQQVKSNKERKESTSTSIQQEQIQSIANKEN